MIKRTVTAQWDAADKAWLVALHDGRVRSIGTAGEVSRLINSLDARECRRTGETIATLINWRGAK